MAQNDKHTFYEVYVTRENGEVSPGTGHGGISEAEWLTIVEQDEDLSSSPFPKFSDGSRCRQKAWQCNSLPEGTPIFFEDGRIFIREDDDDSIEKLIEIAEKLQARVVAEDGSTFFEIDQSPTADGTGEAIPTTGVKVPTYDEIIRKRQSGAAIVICLILPAIVAWYGYRGEDPGELFLWAIGSIALAVYAAVCLSKTKYYVIWPGGASSYLTVLDPKTSKERFVTKEISHSSLDPLELVWFPLKYPKKTSTEYLVRSQKLPWLVFFVSSNLQTAQTKLRSIAQSLSLNAVDLSSGEEAKNIPKKYQLD